MPPSSSPGNMEDVTTSSVESPSGQPKRYQRASSLDNNTSTGSSVNSSLGQQPKKIRRSASIPEDDEEEFSSSTQNTPLLGQPRRRARENSLVNCSAPTTNTQRFTPPTRTKSLPFGATAGATPINPNFQQSNMMNPANKVVTYRERLGGYLHPRDMRRLVTPFSASNEPALIVRRHVMLLNVDPLRAIVLRDRLLVLVPDGADSILQTLSTRMKEGYNYDEDEIMEKVEEEEEEMMDDAVVDPSLDESMEFSTLSKSSETTTDQEEIENVNANEDILFASHVGEWDEMQAKKWIHLPFELQSMDAVLHTVCTMLSNEAAELEEEAKVVITTCLLDSNKSSQQGPDMLRLVKSKINGMESRVQGLIRAINLVLDEDEDLALMNLSRLITHPERFVQPVPDKVLQEESDEPELILEAYLQQSLTNTNAMDLLKNEIDTMEDLMNMQLDAMRNRLLYVNTMVSLFSLVIGVGSFVGSLFGMNLHNGLEEESGVFNQVVIGTCLGLFGLLLILIVMLYRVGAMPKIV